MTTQIIAGGREVHEIPLAGTFDGNSLTGSGTFTSSFDRGKPYPGRYTITDATVVD